MVIFPKLSSDTLGVPSDLRHPTNQLPQEVNFPETQLVSYLQRCFNVAFSSKVHYTTTPIHMTDSAPPPQIFFDPIKKFTPPLPNSTTDLLLSQVLHHLKCCNTAAVLDLTAGPKVKNIQQRAKSLSLAGALKPSTIGSRGCDLLKLEIHCVYVLLV